MEEYIIFADNYYLRKNTKAYYTLDYYGRENSMDTQFIRTLKNTFNGETDRALNEAMRIAENYLKQALLEIIEREKLGICTVVAVPRAKAYDTYFPRQLCLLEAISSATRSFNNIIDGTDYLKRHTNTKTTHLRREIGRVTPQGNIPQDINANDGAAPYCGITKDTCTIEAKKIIGQTIILVDDIYTKNCNVDEDCIQLLYNAGAKKVIFYSFAKTVKRYE